MSAGKGDKYRPVDAAKYRKNYDKAFGPEECKKCPHGKTYDTCMFKEEYRPCYWLFETKHPWWGDFEFSETTKMDVAMMEKLFKECHPQSWKDVVPEDMPTAEELRKAMTPNKSVRIRLDGSKEVKRLGNG